MECGMVEVKSNALQRLSSKMKFRMIERRNRYYWTCQECGANLDPDEKCDCGRTQSRMEETWEN